MNDQIAVIADIPNTPNADRWLPGKH